MDLKQLNQKLSFNFCSDLELANSLKAATDLRFKEHLKRSLGNLHESLKESFENILFILSLLDQSLNPFAFRIVEELISQYRNIELINRKIALSFSSKHLGVSNEQKTNMINQIDQLINAESLFKFESKTIKLIESKQNLYKQFASSLNNQLDELFTNNDLFSASINREQINLNVKREFLTNLMMIIDEFVNRRINHINDWKLDNLKVLFNKTLNTLNEEFKKGFSSFNRAINQQQKEQIDALLKDKKLMSPQMFKDNLESLKMKMFIRLEEIESRYNENVKDHMNSLSKELNFRIANTIQKTCDLILEESRLLIESKKSNLPSRESYDVLIKSILSFQELIQQLQDSQQISFSKKQEIVDEFKSRLKGIFSKLCNHRFTGEELARLKVKAKGTYHKKSP